jgi:condensin complex subunit 1
LLVSGLLAEADIIHNDLEADEQDLVSHHKQLLEVFGFLLQWTIAAVETKAAEKSSTAPAVRGRGKGAKPKTGTKDGNWDSSAQLQTALDTMCKVLKLKLSKIFLTTSERDTFISLFTRPVYMVLESEQRVKNTAIRMHSFKVLCIAVKHHGHGYGTHSRFTPCEVLTKIHSGTNIHRPKPDLLRAFGGAHGRIFAYPSGAVRLPAAQRRDSPRAQQQRI